MARNDSRRFNNHPADPAPWRADAGAPAHSWHALASASVAAALAVAAVVGALALIESLVSPPGSRLARHAPLPESAHPRAHAPGGLLPAPAQTEPALLVCD